MTEQPIGLLAALVSRAVRQLLTAQLEPLGLSTQQFWTIVAVAEENTGSQTELATRLRVDEATACRVVRALGDAGLISPVRDPEDRRRVRLELAPRGQALARRLVPVAREIRSVIEGSLSPEERSATRAALTKVLARLNALIEAAPGASPSPGPAPAPRRRRSASGASAGARVTGRPRSSAVR
jgi:DNA-binding MarR family transcriptional regulator